jgi:Helicase conserved C-terminal domain
VSGYAEFLASKTAAAPKTGRDVDPSDVHPTLFDWQNHVVRWACRTGRAGVWLTTGMGKTIIQVEWARLIKPGGTALIVAPLAVCHQTVREAARIGVTVTYTRAGGILPPGIWVTNFELADRFDPGALDAVVLDEASLLKQATGVMRNTLIRHFAHVPYRLACTATPAPNDQEELTSQAEFLGRSTRADMLAAYFVHDARTWRVKGHARGPMFGWLASWAVAARFPSDLGDYDDDGFHLPALHTFTDVVDVHTPAEGQLFATDMGGVGGRARVRRATLHARCERAAAIVAAEPGEQWLLWVSLNDEADMLAKLIDGAVNVHGAWSPEEKAGAIIGFADSRIRVLITKPSIASLGINWQACARMIFVGLNDSFEGYYQAVRRCYRYGQTRVVHVHIVVSELEKQVVGNVARKELAHERMINDLVQSVRDGTPRYRACDRLKKRESANRGR